LAFLIGVASAFAFQPFGLWPLMPLAFAALCELIVRTPTLRRAMLMGWGFAVGQFCVGLNWIATAFTYQAAMPAWLGWIAVVLLSVYLAAFMMLAAGLAWKYGRDRPLALVLALAGSWALCEYLRSTMFTGFAWNPVGVALVDTPWRETSATIGTYGLSALAVLAGGMLWLVSKRERRAPLGFAAIAALLLTLPDPRVFDSSNPDLQTFDAARAGKAPAADVRTETPPQAPPMIGRPAPSPPLPPAPPPLRFEDTQGGAMPPQIDPGFALDRGGWIGRIRIVQPNIGQADKWREGFNEVAARRLASLSARPFDPAHGPPSVIFWPEAAITDPLSDERVAATPFVEAERARAMRGIFPGTTLVTGGLGLASQDGQTVSGATNSVFILDPRGRLTARYDKAHLVPYGEYLPMRPLLSAIGLSRLAPGDLDFAPGPGPRSLALPGGGLMGLQLCYEIIFSGEVVDRANRPRFIFNPSNDAWFGAWGPPQHLAQARLRAAEEGLPVIRSTPTGISALIDARGRLIASIPGGTAGIIDGILPAAAAWAPPFARFGNVIPMALGFALLFAAIALGRRARYRKT
jgi:apolipoprotein N-acyltransferase